MKTGRLIRRARWWLTLAGTVFVHAWSLPAQVALDAGDARFFEGKIRPLLLARCQQCHGPGESKGGLRLDSRQAALAGGDTGPAIVAGDPEQSLLVDAVRYGPTYQMPPTGKLPEAEVALLVDWVRRGAPWPQSPDAPSGATENVATTGDPRLAPHWAYKALAAPEIPAVRDDAWARGPIDRFILAGLEQAGLQPSPPAGRRELMRRVTYDLTGLPPAPDDLAAFELDPTPEAWVRVVDRLLASPHYGPRWGRHWLDVARYADSNGMDENLAHANAWRYRDYVIDSFNANLPYDQFVREQLAGDLIPSEVAEERNRRLAATGFLAIGPKMLAEDDPAKLEMDVIDEQLDTLGVALLGMTFGCARCHDHKFDPFSMADYYGLAGIFKSTKTMESLKVVARWHERPLVSPEEEAQWAVVRQQVQALRDDVQVRLDAARKALTDELRRRAADYLTAAAECLPGEPLDSSLRAEAASAPGTLLVEAEAFAVGNVRIDFEAYGSGIGVIYNQGTLPNLAEYEIELPFSGTYQVELRYAAAEARPVQLWIDGRLLRTDAAQQVTGSWQPDGQRWETVAVVGLSAGKHSVRLKRAGPFSHFDKLALVPTAAAHPSPEHLALTRQLHRAALDRWIGALGKASGEGLLAAARLATASGAAPADAIAALLALRRDEWESLLGDPAGPAAPPAEPAAVEACFDAEVLSTLDGLRSQIAAAESAAPTYPMVMAVAEGQPQNLKIHVRGSHWTQTDEAPRRFPSALAAAMDVLPADRSGRLELAEWIASADHPLTARVMANRLWRWRFGQGLVRTTDNFGRLGEPPSHPELLDWLARRLVEQGWSLKALHREMLHSAVYQQSAADTARASEADPDNRLWRRMPRRRLEAEEIRDATLAVCGQLDLTMGGSLLATKNREYVASTTSVNNTNYDSRRRSVYLPVVRSALYEVFQAFDFADPSVPNGDRAATTVAPQGLFVLNSPLVSDATAAWAAALLLAPSLDDAGRVRAMFLAAYGREPKGHELSAALALVENESSLAGPLDAATARQRAWQALARVALGTSEFMFLD